MIRALALLLALSGPVVAQDAVAQAPGAELRGLDKVSGSLTEILLARGETKAFGRLEVTLIECRYPVDDPSSNAYAHVKITEPARSQTVFDAWMVAASPALSALDHQRYDVWLIRCKTE
jgi:hypothetical protein